MRMTQNGLILILKRNQAAFLAERSKMRMHLEIKCLKKKSASFLHGNLELEGLIFGDHQIKKRTCLISLSGKKKRRH